MGRLGKPSDQQPAATSPHLVQINGWVINLAHISTMHVERFGGGGCIELTFPQEKITIYSNRENQAAFQALLRFYTSIPSLEEIL